MTKQQVNYHLPEDCCAKCQHSYYNNYEDTQCKHIPGGEIISEGGVCDLYELEPEKQPVAKIAVPPPWAQSAHSCLDCAYSYLNDDTKKPMCMQTGKVIEDTLKKCRHWEGFNDVVIEAPEQEYEEPEPMVFLDGETYETIDEPEIAGEEIHCKDCAFSIYQDGKPWCRKYDQEIDPEDYCYEAVKEGSIVIMEADDENDDGMLS